MNNTIEQDKEKIYKVINSCKTGDHFDSAMKMLDFFYAKWLANQKYSWGRIQMYSEMLGYANGVAIGILIGSNQQYI